MLGVMQMSNVYVSRRLDPPLVSQTVYVPVQYDDQLVRLDGSEVNIRFATGPLTGACETATISLALLNLHTGEVSFATCAVEYAQNCSKFIPVCAIHPFERGLRQILQDGLSIASLAQVSLMPSGVNESAAAAAFERDGADDNIRAEFADLIVMKTELAVIMQHNVRDRVTLDRNNELDLVCAGRVTEPDGGYILLESTGHIGQIVASHLGARSPAYTLNWTASPEAVFVLEARALTMPYMICRPRAAAVCAVARCGVANCWIAPAFVPRALDVDGRLVDLTDVEPFMIFDRRNNHQGILSLRAEPALVRSVPAVSEYTQNASYIILHNGAGGNYRLRSVANIIAPDHHAQVIEL